MRGRANREEMLRAVRAMAPSLPDQAALLIDAIGKVLTGHQSRLVLAVLTSLLFDAVAQIEDDTERSSLVLTTTRLLWHAARQPGAPPTQPAEEPN